MKSQNIDSLPNIYPNSLSTINISEYVTGILYTLDPKKSVGADKIGTMVITVLKLVLHTVKPLYHLYSIGYNFLEIHKMIIKSGNQNSVKCYCPISLLSNVSKVQGFSKITDIISNFTFPKAILHFSSSPASLKLTLSIFQSKLKLLIRYLTHMIM